MSDSVQSSSREKILAAAVAAFAAQGPRGARVDEIAAAAGVNKRMLYHHFGDKTGLLRAVLQEHVLPQFPGGDELDWLADVAPDAWRLLAWDGERSVSGCLEPALAVVAARQRAGEWRNDVSTELMVLCLVGVFALPAILDADMGLGDRRRVSSELLQLLAPAAVTSARPRVRIQPTIRPQDAPR